MVLLEDERAFAASKGLKIVRDFAKCGACRACCTLLSIDEMGKKAHEPCGSLCKEGCGIYETRPDVCRRFQCCWSMGIGPSKLEDRPDRSGVLLYLSDKTEDKSWVFIAVEAFERAAHMNSRFWEYIQSQSDNGRPTFICWQDEVETIAPPGVEVQVAGL
jgi:hypothetical protein